MKEEIQAIWREKHVSAVPPTQESIYHLWWATVKVILGVWYFVEREAQRGAEDYSIIVKVCAMPSRGKKCHSHLGLGRGITEVL